MARMRRMGRQENDTPMRNPIDMAPDFRAGPYKPLPITPDYERPMPSPLPITPDYERGPYRPLPITPDYDRQLPIPPDYGPGPMPMPFQPPFTPEEFDDYFNRRTGFNTSETARENFISRTDGGYPDRQDPSFMDKYGDYIKRGLEYMPTPFPGINLGTGSRILKGLESLYGGNAAEYIDELPATPLQDDQAMQRPQSFTNLDMLGSPDFAFKYSNMDPGRMSYDLFDTPGDPSQDASIRGTYRRTQDARMADEMEGAPRQRTTFSEGYMDPRSFDEMYGGVYDDAIFRTVDPNTNRIEQYPQAGIMGAMPQERQTSGLIQTWRKILENVGEDAANEWLASQQAAV